MTASSDNNVATRPCGEGDSLEPERREQITVRFAGDSGDGMQLTGSQFTTSTGVSGYDLATMPDYPAEIRAPAGSVAGVSSFQIRFSSDAIFTPGNEPDVLVAMNAAALKRHLPELRRSGLVVANVDGFGSSDLKKAGYDEIMAAYDKTPDVRKFIETGQK